MQKTRGLPIRIWRNKWFRRFLMTGTALLVLLPIIGAVYQWTATRNFERRNPPRGELIDVGGHRLHLHRQGQGKGSPVVVIDAGLAGGSYEWDALAAEISTVTEVCTYDRAGYGWSDRGPSPRSSQQIVAELHTLLEKARVKPPYILVGHSFGGQNVRLYASQYSNDVAGLVLVDSANYDLAPDTAPIGQVPKLFHFLDGTAVLGTPRLWAPGLMKEPVNNPAARAHVLQLLTRTNSAHTVYDEMTGQTNWQTTRSALKHLGNKPLVVISRRIEEADFAGEEGQQNRHWLEEQKALVNISNKSKRIVTESKSHFLQYHEPKLIVDSVREMVESVRASF